MAKSKSIAGKIVAGALALAVAAGGVSLIGYTTRDTNGNWFGSFHWADNNITADGGDNTIVNDGENNGMLMVSKAIPLNSYEEYGVSALAENAYSLSVTYTPSNTTYQETTYSMKFADGSDCSAYASLSQTSVGSKTATFSILKPFSKQIIITASCNRNTAIKATTTVDYVGAWNVNLYQVTIGSLDSDIEVICNNMAYGTISPDKTNAFTLTFNLGSFQTQMKAKGYNLPSTISYTCTIDEIGSSFSVCTLYDVIFAANGLTYADRNTTEGKAYWEAASAVMLNGKTPEEIGSGEIFTYSISTHRVYNGTTYSDYNCESNEAITLSSYYGFEVPAQSMTTNTPSIITG
ncbi:MAG: hypothetical protein ACI4MB_05785 [Candidatus Coproplasma sp.]